MLSRCVQKRQGTTRAVTMKLISTSFPKVKKLSLTPNFASGFDGPSKPLSSSLCELNQSMVFFHINAETHCCNYTNELVRRVVFVIEAFLILSKFLSEPLSGEGTEDQFNRPFIYFFLSLPGAVDETAKKAPLCTVNCFRADP